MEKNKKQVAKIAIFITSIFIIFLSISYAFINLTLEGTKRQVIEAGILSLVLDEDENNLTIENALPMYDDVGMLQDAFTFRLINNGTTGANYKLMLTEIGTGTLEKSDVKYGLVKDGVKTIGLLSELDENGVIDSGTIGASPETIEYELRLWIKDTVTDNSTITGKSLSYRVDVEVGQIIEENGGSDEGDSCPVLAETTPNTPQLTSGMIAVTYNESEKTWVKADSTKTNWYDYSNQMWANAVTVTEETRDSYMSLAVGEPISMDDINTMWVWIPRYSYTIKQEYGRSMQKCSELGEITISSPSSCRDVDYPETLRSTALGLCQQINSSVETEEDCTNIVLGEGATFEETIDYLIDRGFIEDTRTVEKTYSDNYANSVRLFPGAIDIKFISSNEKDNGTGKCENCAENWVTPEGFTYGEEEIPGFWMAKFETSILESCTYSQSDGEGCDLTTFTPQVKPNVTSWTGARLSTFFEASRLMQDSENADIYGFNVMGSGTMDVHVLKNTEWGIVAYLSQSKYGKYGNTNYTGANKEIYQSKSSLTGMSNGTPSQEATNTQVTYDTPDTGYGASTTGTIYGVYDMSGGSYEFVMGNYNNYSGSDVYSSRNSGFCGTYGPEENCRTWPDTKYYDLYTSTQVKTAYKFGDATYETFSWYNDSYFFLQSDYPWLFRGGAGTGISNEGTEDEEVGVFYFAPTEGSSSSNFTFRISIKP